MLYFMMHLFLALFLSLWQSVVELIKAHFGYKTSPPDPPPIPYYLVPSHEEPRFSCFVESEAAGVSILFYSSSILSDILCFYVSH